MAVESELLGGFESPETASGSPTATSQSAIPDRSAADSVFAALIGRLHYSYQSPIFIPVLGRPPWAFECPTKTGNKNVGVGRLVRLGLAS